MIHVVLGRVLQVVLNGGVDACVDEDGIQLPCFGVGRGVV